MFDCFDPVSSDNIDPCPAAPLLTALETSWIPNFQAGPTDSFGGDALLIPNPQHTPRAVTLYDELEHWALQSSRNEREASVSVKLEHEPGTLSLLGDVKNDIDASEHRGLVPQKAHLALTGPPYLTSPVDFIETTASWSDKNDPNGGRAPLFCSLPQVSPVSLQMPMRESPDISSPENCFQATNELLAWPTSSDSEHAAIEPPEETVSVGRAQRPRRRAPPGLSSQISGLPCGLGNPLPKLSRLDTWTLGDIKDGRVLVRAYIRKHGPRVCHFERLKNMNSASSAVIKNGILVSCICWEPLDYRKECYITSVDLINLLEYILDLRLSVPQKNRIRRNLEYLHPITVSKCEAHTSALFARIMAFPDPRPRRIAKDIKVFPWKLMKSALQKVLHKMTVPR